jgi:hypothetical protein
MWGANASVVCQDDRYPALTSVLGVSFAHSLFDHCLFAMTAFGRFAAYGGLTGAFYVILTSGMPAMFVDSDSDRARRMKQIEEERALRVATRNMEKQLQQH